MQRVWLVPVAALTTWIIASGNVRLSLSCLICHRLTPDICARAWSSGPLWAAICCPMLSWC
ncbi:hypothetical protein BJX99DRAFT_232281 [Aspergillus californicus]